MKRLFDIILSSILLISLLPILIIISILIFLLNGYPIIFSQSRPGLNNGLFKIYKFRTMINIRNNSIYSETKRITTFGKFLRNYSIDELPELFNVLKGDMSFVGPRPLLPEYLNLYNKNQIRRHSVKPGITGWAQINGRNSLSWSEKFEYDIWYVNNQTFLLDIKIIFITIIKLFKKENINNKYGKIPEKFNGKN